MNTYVQVVMVVKSSKTIDNFFQCFPIFTFIVLRFLDTSNPALKVSNNEVLKRCVFRVMNKRIIKLLTKEDRKFGRYND